jgi:hypothetical protein
MNPLGLLNLTTLIGESSFDEWVMYHTYIPLSFPNIILKRGGVVQAGTRPRISISQWSILPINLSNI